MKIAIIGGGAAGFFAAMTAAEYQPKAEVIIFEKSGKLLSKVKVSGGGRCNVTNATFENYNLAKNYPRGGKELKEAFKIFNSKDTIDWFESRGVELKTEEDGRIFPITDDSHTIIDCFLNTSEKLGIKIKTGIGVTSIEKVNDQFILHFHNGDKSTFNKVLVATGGNPSLKAYDWIQSLDHHILEPVPSLFTFNIPDSKYKGLQGIASGKAEVKITGIKSLQEGPVLITHWGLSGPAVLRLSAWEARTLKDLNYRFGVLINWIPGNKEESLREYFNELKRDWSKKTNLHQSAFFNTQKTLGVVL